VSDTLTVTVNAFTYTLAEGSTGSFFDTDILIANPKQRRGAGHHHVSQG
jgi:hypothetical protein